MLKDIQKNKDWIVGGAVLASLTAGILFAFHDWGRANPIVSFIGGLISGPLFMFFGYGFIMFGVYASVALQRRFKLEDTRSENKMSLLMVGGFLLTALWMVPLFWAAMKIPVVGDQLGFMFRDR